MADIEEEDGDGHWGGFKDPKVNFMHGDATLIACRKLDKTVDNADLQSMVSDW